MGINISLNKLKKLRLSKLNSKIIVLATGVFDILHIEHIRFLKKAKAPGDILIVGIESDKRVKKLKGKYRPVNPQKKRVQAIADLDSVDYAFILPNNLNSKKGREELIKSLKPDIYAISSHTPYKKEKQRILKKFGAKLKIVHNHNPKISSTKIIKLLQKP